MRPTRRVRSCTKRSRSSTSISPICIPLVRASPPSTGMVLSTRLATIAAYRIIASPRSRPTRWTTTTTPPTPMSTMNPSLKRACSGGRPSRWANIFVAWAYKARTATPLSSKRSRARCSWAWIKPRSSSRNSIWAPSAAVCVPGRSSSPYSRRPAPPPAKRVVR